MKREQAIKQYRTQHRNAVRRGIPWELTIDEWIAWWKATGLYHLRGRGPGHYCMIRTNATGAYNTQNIQCVPYEDITGEFWTGTRRRQALRHNKRMSQMREQPVQTPRGQYKSLTEAAKRYKLSVSGMAWRVKNKSDEYYYIT